MKRWIAAVAACLIASACSGSDATPEQLIDPDWLPVNDDYVITFDHFGDEGSHIVPGAGFRSEKEEQEYCSEHWQEDANCIPAALPSSGDIGQVQQPVAQHCWTGPGIKVNQLDIGNQNLYGGACYERNSDGSDHDCAFPGWTRNTELSWKFETAHNNLECTVDRVGHANAIAGRQTMGDREYEDGFLAWRTSVSGSGSGANFVRKTGTETVKVSVLCPLAEFQDEDVAVIAAAGPWGPLRVDGPVSKFSNSNITQGRLGSNYTPGNPHSALAYDQGVYWVYDRNFQRTIAGCGGTTAQREQKMRTLAYLTTLHEVGHILGFSHSTTGIMKAQSTCGDLGNGNGTGPRISVPSVYANLYGAYVNSRTNPTAGVVNADRGFCAQGPAPLPFSSHTREFTELVQLQ